MTEYKTLSDEAQAAMRGEPVSSSTVTLNIHEPPKPKGWCAEQGVAHSWQDGPVLTCNPPIATRECVNCGQRQWLTPGHWEDA